MQLSRLKIVSILVFVSFLCSCTQFTPFVDRRREAGGFETGALYVGQSTETEPAICYSKLFNSFDKIQAMADAECVKNGTGTHAVFEKETFFTCRLIMPRHAYFKCEK